VHVLLLLASQMAPMQQFEMVSETAVHQRYLTVYDRRIKFCAHDNPAEVIGRHKHSDCL
jgi:hypothetical protein